MAHIHVKEKPFYNQGKTTIAKTYVKNLPGP